MVSPTDLMKRLGVGGRLVPFFKCVCVYFAAGGGAPSAVTVAAKCAPVLSLLLLLAVQQASARSRYRRLVCCGLALSALGDALLVWPQYFVWGMLAFGAAHVCYIAAFGLRLDARIEGLALYAATLAFQTLLRPPGVLATLVPLYSILLATMAWRGVACVARGTRGRRAYAAAAGALLFLASDALLAYSLFASTFPYKQALVMSTYYLAQLGLALSALDGPRPERPAGNLPD